MYRLLVPLLLLMKLLPGSHIHNMQRLDPQNTVHLRDHSKLVLFVRPVTMVVLEVVCIVRWPLSELLCINTAAHRL